MENVVELDRKLLADKTEPAELRTAAVTVAAPLSSAKRKSAQGKQCKMQIIRQTENPAIKWAPQTSNGSHGSTEKLRLRIPKDVQARSTSVRMIGRPRRMGTYQRAARNPTQGVKGDGP